MEQRSIAIDGPSGAGKSTLAKMAAKHFDMVYVDTGALYRCLALCVLRSNVDTNDELSVTRLLPAINIEMRYDGNGSHRMILCGADVTDDIRAPEVSMAASAISAMPPVREFLLGLQRDMAVKHDIIMDGRDIGTVVLPGAGLKVFLTALPKTRAQRRYLELKQKDAATAYEDVERDMLLRDKNDSERTVAPLQQADDAVLINTTHMDLKESYAALCGVIDSVFKKGDNGL